MGKFTIFLSLFSVTSQLNEHCEIDLNCQRAEPFSICMITKLCDCREDFIKENGTCLSTLGKILSLFFNEN